ncbi:DUF3086 domain-containing protein [Okeania sp.]|uniref:DUF3086 domain-containing protein n=1 Tax=Okeania sp. TaxID=3100323 RepID=UPI002B4B4110|nr:DUF3086 domain-containing protein [Okeania sp.]MEB3340223.1 DUF3086 domain-containing protein [Okeania sp.]
MHSDEIQRQEQKEQPNNINEITTSPSDLEKKIETETPKNQQVAESFTPDINQSVENISTDTTNLMEEQTIPTVNKIEKKITLEVPNFQEQKQNLESEIATLQETKTKLQQEIISQTQAISNLVPEALSHLEQRKQTLQIEVEKLEKRKERIQKEMRTTFAGASQDLAIRIQGFKDYLVGSLQDLAVAAEQLELVPQPEEYSTSVTEDTPKSPKKLDNPKFAEMGFEEQTREIREILDEYRNMPDYYGPPWRLRRTFEPVHSQRVSNWFFSQGGRGALRTLGSRLQNILVASAIISVLRDLYDTRVRALVLANSPEHMGEWRRGLQDCLGIDRRDFSPERGVALFDDAEILAQKADRLVKQGKLPIIVIDDTEDRISLSMLQFPLWLAFAPEPNSQNN